MLDIIRDLLTDSNLLIEKLESMDKKKKEYSSIYKDSFFRTSWNPLIKWQYSNTVEDGQAFMVLLFLWIKMQKYDNLQKPENKEKSIKILLTELFGTSIFLDLKIEEIKEESLLKEIQEQLIQDCENENLRENEIKSMKDVVTLAIKCKTGDTLYFGKTELFYFLISDKYIKDHMIPIYKNIREMLFNNKFFGYKQVRKRPGMYIGSEVKQGIYFLIFGLIEDLIKDAKEKIISLKLLTQNVLEIFCESYSLENNTQYMNHLAIANALGEFFEYQDREQKIKTEKGILITSDYKNGIAKGIKIIWKADSFIFKDIELDYFMIMNRMIELATLNPYIIYLSDCENQNKIYVPSGIKSFLFFTDKIFSIDIVNVRFTGQIVISFSAFADIRKSYVNSQVAQEEGIYVVKGAKKALKRILDLYKNPLSPEAMIKHLNYVIHIQIENPRWHGSTKRRLKNIEVGSIIQRQVEEQLYFFLKQDIEPLRSIYCNLF